MAAASMCAFCHVESPVLESSLAYARWDLNPVTRGHLLVIPRHVAGWFDLTGSERRSILDLADEAHQLLREQSTPDGFNLGVNVGEAAGQTIFHVHLHLIPRYRGDVENPRGGVRGVIPQKQRY